MRHWSGALPATSSSLLHAAESGRDRWSSSSRSMARPAPLPALERDVLVRRGVGKKRDPAKPRLAHARADAVDEGKLPDRRKDRPLDHQLLDPEEDRLAPRAIELAGLLLVERVDVGVAAVGEHATLDQMSLDARRCIAEGAGACLDDVLVFLFAVFLDEGRALDGP